MSLRTTGGQQLIEISNISKTHLIFVSIISTSRMREQHSFLLRLCNSILYSHSTFNAYTNEERVEQMQQAELAKDYASKSFRFR